MAQNSHDNMMDSSMHEFINFDQIDMFTSPGGVVSPHAGAKAQFAARPSTGVSTPSTLPSSTMAGPSHQYDMYKQQTPLVPGALASTMAVNQNNSQVSGYNLEYMSPSEELYDFNTSPSQSDQLDLDLNQSIFYEGQTVNPNSLEGHDSQIKSPTVPSQTSNVRMYPGMHSQQAAALQMRQRQQQQQNRGGKSETTPLIEAKIAQILSGYRNKPDDAENNEDGPLMSISRPKKDEEDMDEDERLLASEEGKKLSSKERRQLRNKVSARAFRSRRKEYITHLEAQLSQTQQAKQDIEAKNRALIEENNRLQNLTRTLLSSSAFSEFIEQLTRDPNMVSSHAPAPQHQQPQVKAEQRHQELQKDISPYAQQQILQQGNMAAIPEQMDMSMMNMEPEQYPVFATNAYTVMNLPEMPEIDAAALSGKDTTVSEGSTTLDEDKMQVPVIESPVAPTEKSETLEVSSPVSEKPNVNLDGDIFEDEVEESSNSAITETEALSSMNIFGGIAPEKVFARYVLVDVTDDETAASLATKRVEQLAASLEAPLDRLNRLTRLL